MACNPHYHTHFTIALNILVGGFKHFLFFHILGMSSSQLTNSIIFQRGGSTTNQIWLLPPFNHNWFNTDNGGGK
jgi:hypothetical protein